MIKKQSLSSLLLIGSLLGSAANADTIVTTDGATLVGTVTLIEDGVVHLTTEFAGDLEIKQEMVATLTVNEPRNFRLETGATLAGSASGDASGNITIAAEDGTLSATPASIAASWKVGDEDPEVVRNRRKWVYSAAFDFLGKTGNNEELGLAIFGDARLKGPNDTFRVFGEYEFRSQDSSKTEDRAKVGASYENFFYNDLGWYVRTEGEYNDIQFIDFRSTSAGGLSYRWLNEDHWTLVTRSGLGYRFTSYQAAALTPDESSATIDLGLSHMYRFNDTFRMVNDVTFAPAIDDFATFTVLHESAIEMPVGTGDFWFVRLGLRNDYNSRPAGGAEKMDTTYFARLLLRWD